MKKTAHASHSLSALLLIACVILSALPNGESAVTYAAQSTDDPELETVLSGLSSPVYVTSARDGSGRLFVLEQPGRIRVKQPGSASPTVFLDITNRVLSGGERGLLGLAFHPRFETNRRFFVNYTRRSDGATVIAEYRTSASNPNVADTNESVILVIGQPFANHNGGMIEFGPDGLLYIAMGDGGSANDPGNRAQNRNELLGKMLRIDIDNPPQGAAYSSPSDNPFSGPTDGRDEIFAVGLRNPWRFSFDRLSGQLIAGDVGQGVREEIDVITRGGNYGWRVFEGTRCTDIDPGLCSLGAFTSPIAEYSHSSGRCSITGGYVYRGSRLTLPFGSYVFADFCTGEIFLLQNGNQRRLLDTSFNISSFGEDEDGEIFVVNHGGTVHKLTNRTVVPPTPFSISSAFIRKRSNGSVLDPVTVKTNAKKFDIVVNETAAVPTPASQGALIIVNGTDLKTTYTTNDLGTPIFVARLKRSMLATPGQLIVEVIRTDGSRSNQLVFQVVPSD